MAIPVTPRHSMPTSLEQRLPIASDDLPTAADLAYLYIHSPNDPIWQGYLWCQDTDQSGQRVFIGGTANGKGCEIHRHLDLTERWSVPVWT